MLANPTVHAAFIAFCQRACEHNVGVGSYVIMPDHVHVFVRMPGHGTNLAQWVQSLRSVLGKSLLALGHAKPHWQEGFFDHLLRSGESYAAKWNYVRSNPVRKQLCGTPEEWPYRGEIMSIKW
jgi:putative transposase